MGNRGRLRVLLGAAPGVGKTCAMLEEGKRLQDNGVDVVIGLLETHGRTMTARMAEGLPQVCLLYTSPSPRDKRQSRMPSSA